jgi:hypothetical protein
MNASEAAVKRLLEERGFAVHRNGWPDFLCTRRTVSKLDACYVDGRVAYQSVIGCCAVEVKTGADRLRPEQKVVRRILQSARIPVYVVNPNAELDRLKVRHPITFSELKHLQHAVTKAKDDFDALEAQWRTRVADLHSMLEAGVECFADYGEVLLLREGEVE